VFLQNFKMRGAAALLCCCATMLACAQEPAKPASTASAASPGTLHTDISFLCLWWSESQMEGMNPNSPPPKNTEVKLSKWEYSDPIGVPHPDTVDVAVTVQNRGSAALSNLEVEIRVQWKTGPEKKPSAATWLEPTGLNKQGVSVEAGGQQTVRASVDLKKQMDQLEKQKKWPFALRAIAEVRAAGSASVASQAQADLPIKPGD
jgi:hypothetical protein